MRACVCDVCFKSNGTGVINNLPLFQTTSDIFSFQFFVVSS